MTTESTPVLALDCGSTNFKAALFDSGLRRLGEAAVAVPYSVRTGRRVEMAPAPLWEITREVLLGTCAAAGVPTAAVRTIALTSQAQTFAVLDENDTPRTPFLSWIDSRAVDEAGELTAHLGAGFHQHCSFAPPVPELQAAKVLWLQHHAPEAWRGRTRVVSLPEFLASRLAGVAALDANLAAMSGLYSLRDGGWWRDALARCGLRRAQLPRLVRVGEAVTGTAPPGADLGLGPALTLVFGGNDQTSGALGNDCRQGVMVATLGTALVAYRYAGDRPGPYHPGGCWGPFPGGGFYELAARSAGCQALDSARAALMPGASIAEFMATAEAALARRNEAPDDADSGCFFFPENAATAAAWTGAGALPDRALAVVEGISFSLRCLIREDLAAEAALGLICVIGGGSRSDFWLRLLASVLECPVRRGTGDSLLGAAVMAVPGVVPPTAAAGPVWQPDRAQVAALDRRFRRWREQQPGVTP